ncbi:tryptophan 2,3 dioxygenase [Spathaspora passalidarum NRRL Y-27907]|uniref:Indoleamine 2,3-dioxygenase n=1 Tax=Spathaspora passalidarum (strain NRRL Y-27907 / 11-Y1) TaxID=619300 RepID=G3AT14_SPAPN|nr:tryptophan 2,3 dioxygenase [Spathaspora passalidarum NRRL Y-27907]EGW31174.1 tryptophan 2,3 dioxygenase [Spathaspora passalidarum NRRL Y-27907]
MTATIDIPRMEDYNVFPNSGFLPEKLPLERLPQQYYKPWEDIATNLPSLILTKRVRSVIDKKLPLLETSQLTSEEEYRRAYQVLGFLAHAYIWGTEEPTNKLPPQIAQPWVEVSDHLRLPPIATYAGLCLWNFKQIIPTEEGEDIWDLDNLTTINTFTGSIDESWFYLVSVYFEHKGALAITTGLQAIKCAYNNDIPGLVAQLQQLAEAIDALGSVLLRMEEMCDPHVFYFRIRPYLAGWKNMADVGLDKDGVLYGNESKPRAYSGGSNAQSSLIQFLDILLGVKHYSTGERPLPFRKDVPKTGPENGFMNEMRTYMPGPHQDFLKKIHEITNIHDFVLQNVDTHPELVLSYDGCLAMLKSFRDKHIQIVTRYVVLQAKKTNNMGSSTTLRSGLARKKKNGGEEKGTGGTSLLPFLKQCRDETGDPAAGNWGKRILSDGVMRLKYSKPNGINED